MENRLLFESDVIEAIDKHMDEYGELDDDISCILEELKSPVFVGSKDALNNLKVENEPMQKQKRVQLFENEDVVLEQRGNRYYLSLYDRKENSREKLLLMLRMIIKLDLGMVSKFRFLLVTKRGY